MVVVPNGINHDAFNNNVSPTAVSDTRAALNLNNEYLLHVGGLSPHKDLTTLIAAYAGSLMPQRGYDLVLAD